MTKIKLYSMAYQDRSDRVRWLMEEIGLPYENIFLPTTPDWKIDSPDYKTINPMNRVPTIVDGNTTLSESGAICLYLADKYAYGKLAPTMDSPHRAQYLKWMVSSVATYEAVIARLFTHMKTDLEKLQTRETAALQAEIWKKELLPLLSRQEYLLPTGLSACDIMMAAIIGNSEAPGYEFVALGHPAIENYIDRLTKREAALRAKVFG
jgi:glutathione S-transferase